MSEVLTIGAYARLIGRHRNTVTKWIKEGAGLPPPAISLWRSHRGRWYIIIAKSPPDSARKEGS